MNWKLTTGHELSVENEGAQTVVTIHYQDAGVQQRSCNSFTTGLWISPPQLTATPTGALIKIVTPSGESLIEIQGNTMQLHDGASQSSYATTATSYSSTSATGVNGQTATASTSTSQTQRFCTECGTAVRPTDKFCANCGNKLS
jgi:membrane protease subunit (stomatin/prohibitin family)